MILKELREEVLQANLDLVRRGLVLYTFGNASGISREQGLVAIKPSSVPYETMNPKISFSSTATAKSSKARCALLPIFPLASFSIARSVASAVSRIRIPTLQPLGRRRKKKFHVSVRPTPIIFAVRCPLRNRSLRRRFARTTKPTPGTPSCAASRNLTRRMRRPSSLPGTHRSAGENLPPKRHTSRSSWRKSLRWLSKPLPPIPRRKPSPNISTTSIFCASTGARRSTVRKNRRASAESVEEE